MADSKISQLTSATTPLSGTEVVPIVQNGVTKKVAVSAIGGGGASYEVGQVASFSEVPTTGTWLETGKYYSKAAYPTLAAAVGDVVDFGSPVTIPQAQLPQPFNAVNGTLYACATNGTVSVAVGSNGQLRKTTDGINWVGVPSTVSSAFNGVRYVNNKFVAFGATGVLIYSTDGENWTNASLILASTGNVDTVKDIAYGEGLYVVATTSGTYSYLQYSSDLITWTRATSGLSGFLFLNRIIFANGLFVAMGASSTCVTSPDGINWTSRGVANAQYYDIIYENGLYVAVGNNGTCITSTDGASWTTRTTGTTSLLNQVVYGNSLYVICGVGGTVLTSPDGTTWTLRTTGTVQPLQSITWSGSNFVAVGSLGVYLKSTDGLTWTPSFDAMSATFYSTYTIHGKAIGFGAGGAVILDGATRQEVMQSGTWGHTVAAQSASNPRSIAYNGSDLYVTVGSNGAILTSPDGQTWTGRFSGVSTNFDKVAYLNGNWIAMGGTGSATNLLTSSDGVTWTSRTAGTAVYNYAAYGAGVYVVVGTSGALYSSSDLATWTSRSAGAQTLNDVIFANGVFVAVGASSAVYSSPDGITWTLRTAAATFNRIIYANSLFVAIGTSGSIFTSPDGINWTSRTSNLANTLNDIVWNDSLFVVIGNAGIMATSPDAVNWTSRSFGDSGITLLSISWNGTRFVITNSNNGCAFVSIDGITWSRSATAYAGSILFSTYLGGKHFAIANAQIQTSTDGLNWVNCSNVQYVPTVLSRTYKYGSKYYALSTTAGFYQSNDGITWTAARTAPARPFVGMSYNGSTWLAVTGASTGLPTTIYKSTDGTNWTKSADFGTLTSTSTLPTAFIDIEYANGNFIIGGPTTGAQNIVYTVHTSSDGVTWTGRLTPFLAAPATSLASNGSIVIFGTTSMLFKSTDGGVSWTSVKTMSAAPCVYLDGLWVANNFSSTDLDTFRNATNPNYGGIYSDGSVYLTVGKFSKTIKSINTDTSVNIVQNASNEATATGSVTSTMKQIPVRGTTFLVAQNRSEAFTPNLLGEAPLYSYDRATTFYVVPSTAGGGQIAYIYAGA